MSRSKSPKPNAPNSTAWTRPLGSTPPKPSKVAKPNPWTAPLATRGGGK